MDSTVKLGFIHKIIAYAYFYCLPNKKSGSCMPTRLKAKCYFRGFCFEPYARTTWC